VKDALRQKPAVLYVNEVREETDWQSLLYFAGTGHLAITTTHAGSLVETFERILKAARADTPAKRSEVAGRIVAIVHLRNHDEHLIPALWVQTARSRTALTQEGLASLLPTEQAVLAGQTGLTGQTGSCYGRVYFAERLGMGPEVCTLAMQWDLSGE
jgi:hypothetical protein